jgi:hypothetical protein
VGNAVSDSNQRTDVRNVRHSPRRLVIRIRPPMMYTSHNILMHQNFTGVRVYPIHDPEPLLHLLTSQFLVKDMLELDLLRQLPKHLICARSPHYEPSDCIPDLSFGVTEMGSHGHHDRISPVQPRAQLVLLRERGRVESGGTVETDIWWKGYRKFNLR